MSASTVVLLLWTIPSVACVVLLVLLVERIGPMVDHRTRHPPNERWRDCGRLECPLCAAWRKAWKK